MTIRLALVPLLASLLLGPALAEAGTLDPLLTRLPDRQPSTAPGKGARPLAAAALVDVDRTDGREPTVGVILHLDGTRPDLSGVPGLELRSVIGNMATARVPVRSLEYLDGRPGLRFVEASRYQRPVLDVAVPVAQVDDVWYGSPAYAGAGVLVGVIDTGIDWAHDDFRHAGGATRIEALWDFFATGGTGPAGYPTVGVEYDEADINAALAGSPIGGLDRNGHGTHVTGIAAGNGRASSGTYRGVAREADILFAKPWDDDAGTGFSSGDVIDAMNWMVQKADALGRPLVVNLSLGGHYGAHDGTTGQEQVIQALSGPGRVFVVAAGNEGEEFVHDRGNASGTTFTLEVPPYTPVADSGNDYVFLDIWTDGPAGPSVTVTGPSGAGLGPVATGQVTDRTVADGSIFMDNASTGSDPLNGDRRILLELNDSGGTEVASGDWTITVTGGTGFVDAWVVVSTMTAGFPDSDQLYSVGMPATAEAAVSVAAWKSRQSWPAVNGGRQYNPASSWGLAAVGDLAPFSSRGPTRDGRQKPDLAAPGMAMVSCYSGDVTPALSNDIVILGAPYFASQGTSMSSPFVAGVAALLLQKSPALTAGDVRTLLRSTARTDGFTGPVWNARFGMGKVDAQAAMAAVTVPTAVGDLDADGEATVLDVVRLVNHILDPAGHPLSPDAAHQADVFPAGGGDDLLTVQDVVRIVSFILGTENPAAPAPAVAPAVLAVGRPVLRGGGFTVPVTLSGEALAGGQFALDLPGAGWRADGLVLHGDPAVRASARADGDRIRVLLYHPAGALDPGGVTVDLPFVFAGGAPGGPRVAGALAADPGGFARDLDVRGDAPALPLIRFLQAAPNPLRESAHIRYQLGAAAPVRLEIFDVQGRRVRLLRDGPAPAGGNETVWDGADGTGRRVPAGLYLVRLAAGGRTETRKLVVER